ncbi:MAG: RES family NAD+ phosphorylase [Nitrococcus sp.]|nr:RES family NAD+ phosphorylase [Nitrococcus sp.]
MVEERLPPADLVLRSLPSAPAPPDGCLYRIHYTKQDPRYFGTGIGYRFNDPCESYGVCYLAYRQAGAFAETLLRHRLNDLVPWEDIEMRSLATFQLRRPLRLVPLYGRHLSGLRANATATTGRYHLSQAWSRALHDHTERPDGIAYRAAHDDDEIAVALFDRANNALGHSVTTPLNRLPRLLMELFERYRLDG